MCKRRIVNRVEVNIIMRKFNISLGLGTYTISSLGVIDVQGCVDIRYSNLTRLPLKFGQINGSFNCGGLALKSLKGAPEYVRYDFSCNNNELTSLKYGPKKVGGSYNCSNNELEDLAGCATEIGRDFSCKFNKIKSLSGCPKDFYGRFNCSHNRLTNFTGAPERFKGQIYANSNYLKNLKGFKQFDGAVFIDPTASSINTGDFNHKKMKIEIRSQSKFGHEFMPREILDNRQHLEIIVKYQIYYDAWTVDLLTDDDQLHLDNFKMLIEDIEDGLL